MNPFYYHHLRPIDWLASLLVPTNKTFLWINTTFTFAALAWLLWRAWGVLQIPVPDLIELLGHEVPFVPQIALAGIEPTTVTLHWVRPDKHSGIVKHLIQVNGITVGESKGSETAITVSGLRPNHFYGLRVIAVNTGNFQRGSRILRLRTLGPAEQGIDGADDESCIRTRSESNTSLVVHDGESPIDEAPAAGPQIHPTEYFAPNNVTTPATDTDRGGGPAHLKKSRSHRKAESADEATDPASSSSREEQKGDEERPVESEETELTVEQLKEKIESVSQQTEELQLLKIREEEEFVATKEVLMGERDRLKQALKERDDASAELRREVANLERQNRTVQSRKTAKEKALHQKESERQKMRQEMERWSREAVEYQRETEKLQKQRHDLLQTTDVKVNEAREQTMEWQKLIKEMEEDIKLKGVKIKEFELERKRLQGEEDGRGPAERERRAREDDALWDLRLRDLHATYAKVRYTFQQAQENYRQAQERLAWWGARGITSPTQFATMSTHDLDLLSSNRRNQRKNRQSRSPSSVNVSRAEGFSTDARYSYPSAFSVSSFFNINNGTVTRSPAEQTITISKEDMDQLTGGAQMSPTANALLPSNLLEETLSPRIGSLAESLVNKPTLGASTFSALAPPTVDALLQDPNSPDSAGSRAASIFPSPRSSLYHFPTYQAGADSLVDSERITQSTLGANFGAIGESPNHSTTSPRKLSNFFNLNRQRGKTLSTEPPALGTLKTGQTQSIPRNWNTPSPAGELDPIGTKRRKGSQSTSWMGPMTNFNFLTRSAGTTADAGEESPDASSKVISSSRRKPFNMFGSKVTPLNIPSLLAEPTSPRPSSVSSFENALPRPSTDSQPFGWPVQRSIPHGPDWSLASNNDPWSHGAASRRGSAQHGSTSSLSLGTTAIEPDSPANPLSLQSSLPAPIGTRPPSLLINKNTTPRLNPAAPSFKTLFGRTEARKASKAEKLDRAAELEREKERERERDKEFELLNEEAYSSANAKRNSRDTRSSIHTEESSLAESYDSTTMDGGGGGGGGGGRPVSATASISEVANAASSAGSNSNSNSNSGGAKDKDKESIFRKISRKSSSGKFNVPWKDRSIRGSTKKAPAEVMGAADELEDDGGGSLESSQLGGIGKSSDSVGGSSPVIGAGGKSSGGLSWSTLMRKSKAEERAGTTSSSTVDTRDMGEERNGDST
ncbi:MAG: hypothetical protein M1816_006659 [Peltula sp. TS41687]|nr:MAG: hypothetical protein M1816_006659 [Peltula sp. TS41687]